MVAEIDYSISTVVQSVVQGGGEGGEGRGGGTNAFPGRRWKNKGFSTFSVFSVFKSNDFRVKECHFTLLLEYNLELHHWN